MATKAQILTVLQNKMSETSKGSMKYYTIGALWILLNKDAITLAEVQSRFPELA